MYLPLSLPILAAASIHHLNLGPTPRVGEEFSSRSLTWRDILPCSVLLLIPPHSVTPLLRPMARLTSRWPELLTSSVRARLPEWLVGTTGPFGRGCFKACEGLCAYVLLSLRWNDDNDETVICLWPPPTAFRLGPAPSWAAVLVVLLISAATNAVLSTWSNRGRSRGEHGGVNAMVDGSIGRRLRMHEHARLAMLALGNAVCEEIVSRGFFYHEFVTRGCLSDDWGNLAQAAAFGLWHYHGIPSGLVGVGLTFIYGWIMGLLMQYGNGLALPIMAHALADYFIFAVIARQNFPLKQ